MAINGNGQHHVVNGQYNGNGQITVDDLLQTDRFFRQMGGTSRVATIIRVLSELKELPA